jgi:predicted dienelactone hydrolase
MTMASTTCNVGCRALAVADPAGTPVPTWLLYPTRDPERTNRFGPYSIDFASDGALAGTRFSLIVISHGSGSTPWVHRNLARHLVQQGFVVALLEHPGNNRRDNSLANTIANLENRPRHVRLAIDAAFADAALGAALAPAVAIIGHSMGAYTALAVAGGHVMTLAHESEGRARPVTTEHDRRVRAVVLLAPAIDWLGADAALSAVDIPILARTGDQDTLLPASRVLWTLRSVPDPARISHVDVPSAGHYSFLSPFPAEMTRPDFAPSQDPPGFDRAAYHRILYAEIVSFVRAAL